MTRGGESGAVHDDRRVKAMPSVKTEMQVTTDSRFLPLVQGQARVLAEIGSAVVRGAAGDVSRSDVIC